MLDYGGGAASSFLDEFTNDVNGSSSTELLAGALSNFSGLTTTSSLFATTGSGNYSTEFSINSTVDGGSSFGDPSGMAANSRLSFAHVPDLLQEDELIALWNCTNCFLLNYSGSSSGGLGLINGTFSTGRFGNGTDRDLLLLRPDDGSGFGLGGLDDPESTIFLIRMIVTAVVLGIVILATVIGK